MMPRVRRLLRVSNRSIFAFIFLFSLSSSCLYFVYVAPGIGECVTGSGGGGVSNGRCHPGRGINRPGCPSSLLRRRQRLLPRLCDGRYTAATLCCPAFPVMVAIHSPGCPAKVTGRLLGCLVSL